MPPIEHAITTSLQYAAHGMHMHTRHDGAPWMTPRDTICAAKAGLPWANPDVFVAFTGFLSDVNGGFHLFLLALVHVTLLVLFGFSLFRQYVHEVGRD